MSEQAEQRRVVAPQLGPQTTALQSPADIVIIGGSAGGGKSFYLLLEALRHKNVKGFNAVFFRRTEKQIRRKGAIWDESKMLFPLAGGQAKDTTLEWFFPSGSSIQFAHLQFDDSVRDWDGAQIALICFDELQHFSEEQFFYMMSRNRSTCGVKPYIRGSCNPDPDSWLARLLEWWIDQDRLLPDGSDNPQYGLAIPERSGIIRYFVRDGENLHWADTREELQERYLDVMIKSFTFVRSSVYDNKILLDINPEYLGNLMSQMPVEKARLLDGNWKIKHGVGQIFDRSWFTIVYSVPTGGIECRFWDLAATAKAITGNSRGPDYTAGVKMRKVQGVFYVTHVVAQQVGPAEVEALMRMVAQSDLIAAAQDDARHMLRWEQEPGGAGKRESNRMALSFPDMDADGVRSLRDKFTRAMPFAAQARAGGVKILQGEWNEQFLNHLHNQPDWPYDDIMDGTSGAYNALTHETSAPLIGAGSLTKTSLWRTPQGVR